MISISQLAMTFKKKVVLDRIDLKVREGEIFGITGLNGSGKSVFLKVLATLLMPTGGKVKVSGYDIVENMNQVRRLIGYMPDFVSFKDRLSVGEYLAFFYTMYGRTKKDPDRPLELLDALALHNIEGVALSDLSRGEKQKISMARALIHDPIVLLLDDPESGLDRDGCDTMKSLLIEQSRRGKTVVMASRSVPLLNSMAHRIGVFHEGRLMWTFPSGVENEESIHDRIRSFKKGRHDSGA